MFHIISTFKTIFSWLCKSIVQFTLQGDDFQNVPFSTLEIFMKVFVKLSSVGSKELVLGAYFVPSHTSSL